MINNPDEGPRRLKVMMPALGSLDKPSNTGDSPQQMPHLESAPEEPEEDELSELDPDPLLEEADETARSSPSFPAISCILCLQMGQRSLHHN